MRRKVWGSVLCCVFLAGIAGAQTNSSDQLTISTYYPSPYGVYRNVRIYPSNQPSSGVGPGLLYYNQTQNVMKYRNDTAWVNLTGTECELKAFSDSGGDDYCDPGYYTWSAVASSASGQMLCCKVHQ